MVPRNGKDSGSLCFTQLLKESQRERGDRKREEEAECETGPWIGLWAQPCSSVSALRFVGLSNKVPGVPASRTRGSRSSAISLSTQECPSEQFDRLPASFPP